MASFSEFQHHFSENILAIPKKNEGQSGPASTERRAHALLSRIEHSLVHFLHALRRPAAKKLLVTSAVGEGKSTVSVILQLQMRLSGARTLLIVSIFAGGCARHRISSKIGSRSLKRK